MRVVATLVILCLQLSSAEARSGHASGHDGQGSGDVGDVVRSVEELNPHQALEVDVISGIETRVGRAWNCVHPDRIPLLTVNSTPYCN